MTSAMQVARYLERDRVLPEMQLQKLLYYVQAWSLAWTGHPMFVEELEAWVDGPVVQKVWASQRYGDLPSQPEADLADEERAIVDAVQAHYGRLSGPELGARTHADAPWQEARGTLAADTRSRQPLSQASMRRAYTRQALEQPELVPVPPVIKSEASRQVVLEAGRRQSRRWRTALDLLADR